MKKDNWPTERRQRYAEMMRERNLGKPKSDLTRQRMSAAKKGVKQSQEHISKRTAAMVATKLAKKEKPIE